MLAVIFPLAIILIAGLAIMSRVVDESSGISQIGKTTQGSAHAENGVEWGINQLTLPASTSGRGQSWVTTTAATTLNDALNNPGEHVTVDVNGADGARTGIARVVVQPVSGESDQRVVTAVGQQCLNDDCTDLGPERVVKSVIRTSTLESAGVRGAFEYLVYRGDSGTLTDHWLREAWIEGDMYYDENVRVEFDHQTRFIGNIFAHENIINSCLGNWNAATMYSFGVINKNPTDNPGAGCPTSNENYNLDTHDSIFKDVTMDVALDREWFRDYATKYFPADAVTNNGATQNIWFCADASGAVLYKVGTGGTACNTIGTPLLDAAGDPFTSGIVFVAGNIKIEDMMAGSITFVAAGPNTGSSFGTLEVRRHLYSKDTENGLGTPSCGQQRAAVPGGTDAIGLVADRVIIPRVDDRCLTLRAVVHVVKGMIEREPNGSLDVPGTGDEMLRDEDEPFYFRGSIVVDDPETYSVRGEASQTPAWSLRVIFDPELVGDNMPTGVIGGDSGAGASSVSVERISYGEVTLR